MILLCLESSTSLGGVALFRDGRLLAEASSERKRSHSEFLNLAIDEILRKSSVQLSEIDLIAVTKGPGSFTGIRVAGNLAKTLGYSLQKKIWVTDTLTVLAKQIASNSLTIVGLNAFKNMLYLSVYENKVRQQGPMVMEFSKMESAFPSGFSYIGDAAELMPENLKTRMNLVPGTLNQPTATLLGQVFFESPTFGRTIDWNSFVPLYLRGSEAEENLRLRASE